MSQIDLLRRKLDETIQAIDALEGVHYWLKGWGVGWLPEHYGMSRSEWEAVRGEHFALRERRIFLDKEIARLRKIARPGRGSSLMAHRT